MFTFYQSAGAFLNLDWPKKNELNTHAYLLFVFEGCVSSGCVSEAKAWATLTQRGELWKGGGHEIMLAEPPLSFTDCSSQLCGDFGCPPPQLFIWCRPKQKEVGVW